MRATEVSFSVNSSRPKKVLGGRSGCARFKRKMTGHLIAWIADLGLFWQQCPFIHSAVEQDTNITHQPMFIVGLALAHQRANIAFGTHGVGTRSTPVTVNLSQSNRRITSSLCIRHPFTHNPSFYSSCLPRPHTHRATQYPRKTDARHVLRNGGSSSCPNPITAACLTDFIWYTGCAPQIDPGQSDKPTQVWAWDRTRSDSSWNHAARADRLDRRSPSNPSTSTNFVYAK